LGYEIGRILSGVTLLVGALARAFIPYGRRATDQSVEIRPWLILIRGYQWRAESAVVLRLRLESTPWRWWMHKERARA